MNANDKQVGGSHYQTSIQHWDIIEDNDIPYLEGNATKYVTRAYKKNGLQDVQKAIHYVEKLAEKAECGRVCRSYVPVDTIARFCEANELTNTQTSIISILLGKWTSSLLGVALLFLHQLEKELMAKQEEEQRVLDENLYKLNFQVRGGLTSDEVA